MTLGGFVGGGLQEVGEALENRCRLSELRNAKKVNGIVAIESRNPGVDGTAGHEHKDGACRAWYKHSKARGLTIVIWNLP